MRQPAKRGPWRPQPPVRQHHHVPRYHTVRKGESFGIIAQKYNLSVTELKRMNGLQRHGDPPRREAEGGVTKKEVTTAEARPEDASAGRRLHLLRSAARRYVVGHRTALPRRDRGRPEADEHRVEKEGLKPGRQDQSGHPGGMRHLLSLLLLALAAAACDTIPSACPMHPGPQGEVLVVMDKGHWESEPGALVRSSAGTAMSTLPQREPRFKVVQCTPQHFGSLLRRHHTVLLPRSAARDTVPRPARSAIEYRSGQAARAGGRRRRSRVDPCLRQRRRTATVQPSNAHQLDRIATPLEARSAIKPV